MGKTIAEKILARASGQAVREVSAKRIFNPEMVNIVMGHVGSGSRNEVGEKGVAVKEFAREMGIPHENIYDLGRQGVEHIFAGERCWALPGETFFQAVNGRTTTLGALGAFAVTLSYGSSAA